MADLVAEGSNVMNHRSASKVEGFVQGTQVGGQAVVLRYGGLPSYCCDAQVVVDRQNTRH